jgi:polyisoprenyl-phosphate glycosyltransferase
MAQTIAIVLPVLDDWVSFVELVREISERFDGSQFTFHICAVDDGSFESFDPANIALPNGSCVGSIEIIRLAANLGHQRAIAIGLCEIAERAEADTVLVMDSDGQDRPADIALLLSANCGLPRHVVFGGRVARSEPSRFRLCYGLYRILFRVSTGNPINFGNFCAMPISAVRRLVHMPELWNHLAAAVMRSRLPYVSVPTSRGERIAGRSRMSLAALIAHGLSAMSVYADKIFIRLIIAAGVGSLVTGIGFAALAVVRLSAGLAVPGWTGSAVGDLSIVLLQTLVIAIAASLTQLAGRSRRSIIPIADCRCYVAERQRCRFEARLIVEAARPAA